MYAVDAALRESLVLYIDKVRYRAVQVQRVALRPLKRNYSSFVIFFWESTLKVL